MTLSAVRGKRILYFIILFAKVSKPLSWKKKKNNRFWVRRLLDLSSETGTWSFILTKQVTNICPTGSSCTVKHLNIFTLISACTWIQTKCFLLSTNISIATFFTKDDHFSLLPAPLYPSEIYRNHPRLWTTLPARICKDCPKAQAEGTPN